MFRFQEKNRMRRMEKEINNRRDIETVLSKATICRIGLIDEKTPYIVPLNFGYRDNCLYFHSAQEGKKIDLIKKNKKVSFEVDVDHGITNTGIPCNWSSTYKSVMGVGNASLLVDPVQKKEALNIIIDHYAPGTSYEFTEKNLKKVIIIKIEIIHMTGKQSK